MVQSTWVNARGFGLAKRALQAALLLVASVGSAATPVESTISLETYARVCEDGTCAVILSEDAPVDSDSQLASLNPLSALVNAFAQSVIGATAEADLTMNATFASSSSGNVSFIGDLGIHKPLVASTQACTATNSTSQGFSYTFVSSADGLLTIDYSLDCTPTGDVNFCGGQFEFYLDDLRIPAVGSSVSTANPTTTGTVTRSIALGATHTFEIRPLLGNVGGGTGCSTPGGFAWGLSGNASWSFDAAAPVPVPAASWLGFALLVAFLVLTGAALLGRRGRDYRLS